MKRFRLLIILAGLVMVASVLMPITAQASITLHTWLKTTYKGYDAFYDASVTAYQTGSTATLQVLVYNDRGEDIFITGAGVEFDWTDGEFATIDYPNTIKEGERGIVIFNFTVPSTSSVSNLITYSYIITVEYENDGGGEGVWTTSGSGFAVYSLEQSEAMNLKQQVDAMGTPSVNTAKARELLTHSAVEEQLAGPKYEAGDFAQAKTHYQNALTFKQDALSADRDPTELSSVEPLGTLLKGIGIVLLGLGLLIYAFRRL
jgi:hypothetical protein